MITAGLDVGSRTIKAVLLKDGNWLTDEIMPTGANSINRARRVLNKAIDKKNIEESKIKYIVATGYGRINVDFADEKITEITCHGVGAHNLFPRTRTIIDIGGQDSKVIRLDQKGRVEDFIMNDKCAAGTGRFLEVMADNLEVPLDDIGMISLKSNKPADISSTCTVFAESEVISLVAEGVSKSRILKGLHTAIVKRLSGMIHRIGLNEEVTMTGGVCHNQGVFKILEEILDIEINRPQKPQFIGAFGAARLAAMKVRDC